MVYEPGTVTATSSMYQPAKLNRSSASNCHSTLIVPFAAVKAAAVAYRDALQKALKELKEVAGEEIDVAEIPNPSKQAVAGGDGRRPVDEDDVVVLPHRSAAAVIGLEVERADEVDRETDAGVAIDALIRARRP